MSTADVEVHDTAFVISCYRASDEVLSGDPYSKLLITEKAQEWVRTYTEEVCPHEPFVHCLRNRFFLEQVSSFFQENQKGVLINVGSGFSLYPYLLPAGHSFCDVDLEAVISVKQANFLELERAGQLPSRNVHYVSADLNHARSRQTLETELAAWLAGRPAFILIEGVIFFLKEESVRPLFEMFARVQGPGDRIGSVSFVPEILNTAVYRRFLDYFERRLGQSGDDYTELETSFYTQLDEYTLLMHTDYCELSRRYAPERTITDATEILNEHMYILERIKL